MKVDCPICQCEIDWDMAKPYQIGLDGVPQLMDKNRGENEDSWVSRRQLAYRPCKDDIRQAETHFLPWDYADYTPVHIGLIGQSLAGKSHLLTAMIFQLLRYDGELLRRAGIAAVSPLDLRAHRSFELECLIPLMIQHRELPGTRAGNVQFCDALKVTNTQGQSFAVTFFDLAGETLQEASDKVRFYARASALIFVVDAASLPKLPGTGSVGDATFNVALKRIEGRPGPAAARPFIPVATALVLAKSDLLEFHDTLPGDWLARGSLREETDLSTIERESEDVFVYLKRRGAENWLRPARESMHSTMHFASATNSTAVDQVFPASFRPRRVLKPLLSVFALTGVIDAALLQPRTGDLG